LPAIWDGNALTFKKAGNGFLVWNNSQRVLFCEGGLGASNFADSSYVLCHCKNAKEIVFVGTGGGIGKSVENADINVPLSCVRLDKVTEVLFPAEVPAKADKNLAQEIRVGIEKTAADLGVRVHSGLHATVPFLFAETKELLVNLQKQGALSIDIELSVLYVMANHYGKKVAGAVRIGDLPLKGLPTWKSRSYKLQLKKEVHRRISQGIVNHFFVKP
jgi:purine-nucleoside phosphorylase